MTLPPGLAANLVSWDIQVVAIFSHHWWDKMFQGWIFLADAFFQTLVLAQFFADGQVFRGTSKMRLCHEDSVK